MGTQSGVGVRQASARRQMTVSPDLEVMINLAPRAFDHLLSIQLKRSILHHPKFQQMEIHVAGHPYLLENSETGVN